MRPAACHARAGAALREAGAPPERGERRRAPAALPGAEAGAEAAVQAGARAGLCQVHRAPRRRNRLRLSVSDRAAASAKRSTSAGAEARGSTGSYYKSSHAAGGGGGVVGNRELQANLDRNQEQRRKIEGTKRELGQ